MRPKVKSWTKRILIDVSIIAVVVGLALAKILYNWAVPLGDFDTVHPVPKLTANVLPITPEKQVEKHTCGLHAISAIYRSYGLDPKERRLRPRLGVDNIAFAYDASTTGCLHPDIYRVMTQDGFVCKGLDLADPKSKAALKKHLDEKHFVLALIKRRETGNMHWIVICGHKGDSLLICDSLKPGIYEENLDDYWNKCLMSLILVSPTQTKQSMPVWRLHLRGLIDMYDAFHHK
jgi:hypothetical protein